MGKTSVKYGCCARATRLSSAAPASVNRILLMSANSTAPGRGLAPYPRFLRQFLPHFRARRGRICSVFELSVPGPRPSDCHAGDAALARGAWAEARDAFQAVLARRESAEA